MKQLLSLTLALALSIGLFAQGHLPTTKVKTLEGKRVSFNETIEDGKVTLVSFWATWCVPCKKEIKNVKNLLPEWQQELDFNYMTVSEDDSRASAMVKAYSKTQKWSFPTYLDPNGDLKRSLNFQNVPFTIIVDENGEVVYSHQGYEEGAEYELYDQLKKVAPKAQTGEAAPVEDN